MTKRKNTENWFIWTAIVLLITAFLIYPLILILIKSFQGDNGILLASYVEIFCGKGFMKALGNSFGISALSALITTVLAFLMAYTVNYTNLKPVFKKFIKIFAVLPMLLPTITYGFAIIYSFGKQGLYTRLL